MEELPNEIHCSFTSPSSSLWPSPAPFCPHLAYHGSPLTYNAAGEIEHHVLISQNDFHAAPTAAVQPNRYSSSTSSIPRTPPPLVVGGAGGGRVDPIDESDLALRFAGLHVEEGGHRRGAAILHRDSYGSAGAERPLEVVAGDGHYPWVPRGPTSIAADGRDLNGHGYAGSGWPLMDYPRHLHSYACDLFDYQPLASDVNSYSRRVPPFHFSQRLQQTAADAGWRSASWNLQSSPYAVLLRRHYDMLLMNEQVNSPSHGNWNPESLFLTRNSRSAEDFGWGGDGAIFERKAPRPVGRNRHLRFDSRTHRRESFAPDFDLACFSDLGNRASISADLDNLSIDHIVELMADRSGTCLLQELLELCNEEQRMKITLVLSADPAELCRMSRDLHGTKSVQKLIETLQTRLGAEIIVTSLKPELVDLMKHSHGYHVIQSCLSSFSPEDNMLIFNVAVKHCIELAQNRHGCCVLQSCVDYCTGGVQARFIALICNHGYLLATHAFGNFVVQHILDLRDQLATKKLLLQFKGHYVELSKQKFGSHVVQKCLNVFQEQVRKTIIVELLSVPRFDELMQDRFANYVIQSALKASQGSSLHAKLVGAIRPHTHLRTSPYCKEIFSVLNR